MRSSVVSPMAETTTATLLPFFSVSTTRLATRLIDSVSATDEPPYFCTMRATAVLCSSLGSICRLFYANATIIKVAAFAKRTIAGIWTP